MFLSFDKHTQSKKKKFSYAYGLLQRKNNKQNNINKNINNRK